MRDLVAQKQAITLPQVVHLPFYQIFGSKLIQIQAFGCRRKQMRTLRIVIFYLVPVTGATSWLFRVARSALDSAAASARSSCRRDREHRRHVCRYSVRSEGSEACPRRYSQTLQPFPEQRRGVNGESNVHCPEIARLEIGSVAVGGA